MCGRMRNIELLAILAGCCINGNLTMPLQIKIDSGPSQPEPAEGQADLLGNLTIIEPSAPAVIKTSLYQSVTLVCQAASRYGPAPLITWLKNGRRVRDRGHSRKIQQTNMDMVEMSITRSVFVIDCVSPSDVAAVYTCVADNTFNRVQMENLLVVEKEMTLQSGLRNDPSSKTCNFIRKRENNEVNSSPKIVLWSPATMQEQGRTVTLFCRATGFPAPQVTWELHYGHTDRDGNKRPILNDSRHAILHNGDLVIRDLEFYEDMGTYVCTAQNSNGADRATAFVYPSKPER